MTRREDGGDGGDGAVESRKLVPWEAGECVMSRGG